MDAHTVRYWSRHTKELRGSQVKKAQELVLHECIQYRGEGVFLCLPLNTSARVVLAGREYTKVPFPKDYNTSEYELKKRDTETFECNCQGWQTRARRGEIVPGGANCSHVLALYYALKLKKFQQKKLRVVGC